MNFLKEMEWRGMIHNTTPGLESKLNEKPCLAYVGFDPSADSLHIGNLVPIMLLIHFQNCGHIPVALIGGATGLIGDPSGKSSERNLLSKEEVESNIKNIKYQLESFLNLDSQNNPALIVNNIDWCDKISMIDFFRDIGKSLTLNYMMSKESVKNRMESGISFTEFSYQLIQAYDFYHLYNSMNCEIQIGGSDQWGNITSGIELIKKVDSKEAHALTTPLLTKQDGTKFGKSESGNIWLDSQKTSSYKFFQYWMNSGDTDAKNWIKIFTTLGKEQIYDIIKKHEAAPHQRLLQTELAKDITTRVHGVDKFEQALRVSKILFGKNTKEEIKQISNKEFEMVFEGVEKHNISINLFDKSVDPVSLLTEHSKAFASKSELRRLFSSNAISINKKRWSQDKKISKEELLNNKYLLVQKGKKNYIVLSFD